MNDSTTNDLTDIDLTAPEAMAICAVVRQNQAWCRTPTRWLLRDLQWALDPTNTRSLARGLTIDRQALLRTVRAWTPDQVAAVCAAAERYNGLCGSVGTEVDRLKVVRLLH